MRDDRPASHLAAFALQTTDPGLSARLLWPPQKASMSTLFR